MGSTVKSPKKIMLALQGGGAHGAYTWGVLERLLAEPNLEIIAVTGTSAGAMNAAVLAYGLGPGRDDRTGAANKLREFWTQVSALGELWMNPYRFGNPLNGTWNTDELPPYIALSLLGGAFSPYDAPLKATNPLIYPLQRCLPDLKHGQSNIVPLYVCATNVKSMRRRIFASQKGEITYKALEASAAVPSVFRAVEAEPGEFYWDGGFMGNPVLSCLLNHKDVCPDMLIVEINPWQCHTVPERPWEIANRQNEITFSSSLALELNALQTVNELLPQLKSEHQANKKHIFFHHIPSRLADLGVNSKFNSSMDFLEELRQRGEKAASDWLEKHWQDINTRSSLTIKPLLDSVMSK